MMPKWRPPRSTAASVRTCLRCLRSVRSVKGLHCRNCRWVWALLPEPYAEEAPKT
jgi:hypothetical protein